MKSDCLSLPEVCALVCVFVFCWTPYAVLSLAGICGYAQVRIHRVQGMVFTDISCYQDIPLSFTVLPLQFAKSSILWNPVIYVIMNPMVGHC